MQLKPRVFQTTQNHIGVISSPKLDIHTRSLWPLSPLLREGSDPPLGGETEALCVHLTHLSAPEPGFHHRPTWLQSVKLPWASGWCGPKAPLSLCSPRCVPPPGPRAPNSACAVLVCRLPRQQGQGCQLLGPESPAGSQAPDKLQDGHNNNVLGHACSRSCSS